MRQYIYVVFISREFSCHVIISVHPLFMNIRGDLHFGGNVAATGLGLGSTATGDLGEKIKVLVEIIYIHGKTCT